MIIFFPDPYPDELLYSALARYHYYIGNDHYVDTNFEVYGVRKPISNLYFGAYLDFLSKSLQGSYSVKEIIFAHTIFPFYQPFISEDLRNEIIDSMNFCNPNFATLTLFRIRICKKEYLYYCPKCANEDINNYGEPYFHVEHQLDGILVCSKHKLLIKPYLSYEPLKDNYAYKRFDKSKVNLKIEFPIVNETYKKMVEISKLSHELFSLDTSNINKQKLCDYYKNILKEKGFATLTGKIRRRELKVAMVDYYGEDFLNSLESLIEVDNINNWVDLIFQNRNFIHPIRHLLLINFLGQTIAEVIENIDKNYKYFGDGPWPCMNHICNYYKADIIKTIDIKYAKEKVIIGFFKCDVCGFEYTRVYSKDNDDKYEIRLIVDRGDLWHKTLIKYAEDENYSIKQIANIMDLSPTSISDTLKKLKVGRYKEYNTGICNEARLNEAKNILLNAKNTHELSYIRKTFGKQFDYILKYEEDWLYTNLSYKKKAQYNGKEKLETYKQKFIKLKQSNQSITLSELSYSLSSTACSFIKKNDPKWWEENAPKSKYGTNHKCGLADIRVKWDDRDDELLLLLKDKHKEICNRENVTMITKNLFKKEIYSIPITQYSLERMPKSKIFIESIVDSTQSYKIKCYKKFLYDKYKSGNDVTIHIIPRKFHNFYKQDEFVKKELEEYIDILKKQVEII
jgi:transposase